MNSSIISFFFFRKKNQRCGPSIKSSISGVQLDSEFLKSKSATCVARTGEDRPAGGL